MPLPTFTTQPRTPFLTAFVHHNGFGNSTKSPAYSPPPPVDLPAPPVDKPPDSKILCPHKFYHSSKSLQVSYLHFFDTQSSVYIHSFATDPHALDSILDLPLEGNDEVEDFSSFIPAHY
ncbi:hypothetical protein GYMLUDRAFT_253078 [Collybiopsis luxurians FD-317 M1]|uniref:Uncharacterized protein n=1 Tax=Collybiopsis luxurians FD-317 M1 TaxID=944289 RepID=A0A0D0BLN8_9AGAR|nr:hypothetical protein GYMLUDRAFT_253078 [Collybiopsis luxurians FD-317 M1]